ncbi:MAG: prenyltransferase/squalene oxidase repeat-containing protein [Chthoniobacteraceae bacterium]
MQEKIAQSRFFTFSLLLHVVIVVLGGGVVLFHKSIDAPDFTSEGGDLMSAETSVQAPVEQPPDMTQQQTVTPDAPSITAPTVSAITTTATNNTSFQMANIPVPVKVIAGDAKKLSDPAKAVGRAMGKGVPSAMGGRMGGTARGMAMKKEGGKDKSEKAVMQGLRWLKDHQNPDGSWSNEYNAGMTGLAMLCFLGHGELPESPEFGETVKKALDWILARGTEFQGRMSLTKDGWGGNHGVYEHGILTYAICEYFSMTKDERFTELVKMAIGHIVSGQNPAGGWDYSFAKGPRNDLSVAGWQIQALKAAHLTGLGMPGVDEALDKAMPYLKSMQGNEGGFGYTAPAEQRLSLTGVGVLCTYFWKESKDRSVKEGIDFILGKAEVKYKGGKSQADLYAWYYHTQACLMFGGSAWSKWNRMFQDEIADNQSPDGSWPPTAGAHGPQPKPDGAGPYYRTTLCILMLEVFYRYMPSTK